MTIRCKIFGHSTRRMLYGKLFASGIDGIGREHGYVRYKCDRCEVEFRVCDVHLIPTDKQRRQEVELRNAYSREIDYTSRLSEAEKVLQDTVTSYYEGLFK